MFELADLNGGLADEGVADTEISDQEFIWWNKLLLDEEINAARPEWVPDELFFPVNLLRDWKGVYGIRAVDIIDRNSTDLIIRPDRLRDAGLGDGVGHWAGSALQQVTGDGRLFSGTIEEFFRREIHMNILQRGGHKCWGRPPIEKRDRQIYFGAKQSSKRIINKMTRQVLAEAADQEALKLARRFRFPYRYNIYRAAALSRRTSQLIAAFPALAIAIYGTIIMDEVNQTPARRGEAVKLVEAGAPLKDIADLMGVPMAFRKVKPGAADLVFSVADVHDIQRLTHAYMPDSLPRMKLWLRCVYLMKINEATVAFRQTKPEFIEWIAKNASEMLNVDFLSDIMDWVAACNGGQGKEFVVRKFSPDMSLRTVTKLSADWHDAVATKMSGPAYEFPEPWCPAGRSGKFEIIPITNSVDLYQEGRAMHHCAGAYGRFGQSGTRYLYSVRDDEKRVATLELDRDGDKVVIGQLRGKCNVKVPPKVTQAVKSWLRSQTSFKFPVRREPDVDGCPDELDIPF